MNLLSLVLNLLRLYEMLLFIRILLSWVPLQGPNKAVELLVRVTDPVLLPAREIYTRLMERLGVQMPIDLSPILVFVLLHMLQRTLMSFALY